MNSDAHWMQAALALARKGEGLTRPNPPVGAVVVRDDRLVSGGYHHRAGRAHAEVNALRKAGRRAAGATLYVTLEPCSTHGRTPACTDRIVAAGIARVVVGTRDPNPAHAGRGIDLLRQAGIDCIVGVEPDDAVELIRPFARWIRSGRPYVTLKMAMSLDGRIADARGRSRWISGPASRRLVHDLRCRCDAVMVGAGTVRADDPSLLPSGRKSHALRVVVAGDGRLPAHARVLTDGKQDQTLVVVTTTCPSGRMHAIERRGVQVCAVQSRGGGVSLKRLLRELGKRGCLHVLCEGGARLAYALVAQDLVDEAWFFVAPTMIGADGAHPVINGPGWALGRGPGWIYRECRRVGDDVLLRAVRAGRCAGGGAGGVGLE